MREPIGVPFLILEIPQGKRLISIDTSKTPNLLIFEDIIAPFDPVKWEELNLKVLELESGLGTEKTESLKNTITLMKALAEVYEKVLGMQVKSGGKN